MSTNSSQCFTQAALDAAIDTALVTSSDMDAFWLIICGQVGGSARALLRLLLPVVCSIPDADRFHAPGGRLRAGSACQVTPLAASSP